VALALEDGGGLEAVVDELRFCLFGEDDVAEEKKAAAAPGWKQLKKKVATVAAAGAAFSKEETRQDDAGGSSGPKAKMFPGCSTDRADAVWAVLAVVVLVAVTFLYAFVLEEESEWGVGGSAYFAWIACTTIGLGDYAPSNDAMSWSIVVLPLGLALVGRLVASLDSLMSGGFASAASSSLAGSSPSSSSPSGEPQVTSSLEPNSSAEDPEGTLFSTILASRLTHSCALTSHQPCVSPFHYSAYTSSSTSPHRAW
jgi:hypothetical protein